MSIVVYINIYCVKITKNKIAPRPEFESESLARQARMIGHYTTRANK